MTPNIGKRKNSLKFLKEDGLFFLKYLQREENYEYDCYDDKSCKRTVEVNNRNQDQNPDRYIQPVQHIPVTT